MMDIETALAQYLGTHEPLTDLIGAGEGCRYYPNEPTTTPALPYVVATSHRDEVYTSQDEPPTLARSAVHFSCFAKTAPAARQLAAVISAALVDDFEKGSEMGDVQVYGSIPDGTTPAYQFDVYSYSVDASFKVMHAV